MLKKDPKFRLVFGLFKRRTEYIVREMMKGDFSYYKIIIMLLKLMGIEMDQNRKLHIQRYLLVVLDFSMYGKAS